MPRWRRLPTKVVESVDLNAMPDHFTRLLWVLLPTQVCNAGRGPDHGPWVRAKVFPMRDDVALEMVERAMVCVAERGMIRRYEVDGRRRNVPLSRAGPQAAAGFALPPDSCQRGNAACERVRSAVQGFGTGRQAAPPADTAAFTRR
jgi:hypothetical protein